MVSLLKLWCLSQELWMFSFHSHLHSSVALVFLFPLLPPISEGSISFCSSISLACQQLFPSVSVLKTPFTASTGREYQ